VSEVDAKLLVEQGRDLALGGNIEGSIVKFKEAKERDENLDFDPKAEAERLSKIPDQIEKGLIAAKQGNREEAVGNFQAAIDLDPTLRDSGIEPEREANRLYALSLLNDKAQDAIGKNNIEQAIKYYKEVKMLYPEIVISAKTLDSLCRAGSTQRQYANDIMKYCDDAVRLDAQRPDRQNQNGKIRDSRGIARLFLKQDIKGAIADFQAFINWTQTGQARSSYNTDEPLKWKKNLEEWKKQRQQCIDFLRSDQKPKITSPADNKISPKTQIPDSCKPIEFKL
jgi:tetratricopeptide (TPR) repeat protein